MSRRAHVLNQGYLSQCAIILGLRLRAAEGGLAHIATGVSCRVLFGVDVWIAISCYCDIDDADLTADGSVENLGIRLYPR